MQVKDLTIDELKDLIRETVLEALEDLVTDPDAKWTVKPEFEQSLMAIRNRRKTGNTGISAEDVARR